MRPGGTLSVRAEVRDKEPWQGNLGLVRSRTHVYSDDTEVMAMVGLVLYEMREP